MEQEVRDVLEQNFPDIIVNMEVLPDGRLAGHVISADFAGLDQVDRQTKIRTVLKQYLGAKSLQVDVLLTYTPDEIEEMNAA